MINLFTGMQPLEVGETSSAALSDRVRRLGESAVIDRVLVGYSSIWPHNHATAPFLLALSDKISPIVAHRPGVMSPVAAARYFATLDVLAEGRLAINVVVGGSEKDLRREGDYTPKAERYQRAIEYLDVMKRTWADPESFDHHGHYYDADAVKILARPVAGHVPIFMGGESDDAVDFGARHADLYMLWGEPLAGTRERVDRVRRRAWTATTATSSSRSACGCSSATPTTRRGRWPATPNGRSWPRRAPTASCAPPPPTAPWVASAPSGWSTRRCTTTASGRG
jgi:alkanesulfonate monooxygenase